MEIAETSIFTKEIIKLLADDEYRKLQNHLVKNPKPGDVIKGSGGIRNIYYYHEESHLILMIFVYQKSKTSDLTPKQIEMLRKTFIKD